MLSRLEIGAYSPTAEPSGKSVIHVGRRYQPGSTRGVIYCHGRGVDGFATHTFPGTGAKMLADQYGVPMIAADLGLNSWGNDASSTRLDEAWAYLIAKTGCASDKVLLYAHSMGTATVLNWARKTGNAAKVAAAFINSPAADLDVIHTGTIPASTAYTADIDTAYSSAWAAAKATHSPVEYAASLAGLFPIRTMVAQNDEVVGPTMGRTLATLIQSDAYENAGTHSSSSYDVRIAISFLAKYA